MSRQLLLYRKQHSLVVPKISKQSIQNRPSQKQWFVSIRKFKVCTYQHDCGLLICSGRSVDSVFNQIIKHIQPTQSSNSIAHPSLHQGTTHTENKKLTHSRTSSVGVAPIFTKACARLRATRRDAHTFNWHIIKYTNLCLYAAALAAFSSCSECGQRFFLVCPCALDALLYFRKAPLQPKPVIAVVVGRCRPASSLCMHTCSQMLWRCWSYSMASIFLWVCVCVCVALLLLLPAQAVSVRITWCEFGRVVLCIFERSSNVVKVFFSLSSSFAMPSALNDVPTILKCDMCVLMLVVVVVVVVGDAACWRREPSGCNNAMSCFVYASKCLCIIMVYSRLEHWSIFVGANAFFFCLCLYNLIHYIHIMSRIINGI